MGRFDCVKGQGSETVWEGSDGGHGSTPERQRVQQHTTKVVVEVEPDDRVTADELVHGKQSPKVFAVPPQVVQEPGVDDQCFVVVPQGPAGLETEGVVGPRQDAEQGHLGDDPSVREGALGGRQQNVGLSDRLHLRRHGGSAVGDAEVVVQHVEEVPQPRTFQGLLSVFRWGRRVERLEERLVEVEFGGHPHAVAGQFPREVRQPKRRDTQRPHVLERV